MNTVITKSRTYIGFALVVAAAIAGCVLGHFLSQVNSADAVTPTPVRCGMVCMSTNSPVTGQGGTTPGIFTGATGGINQH